MGKHQTVPESSGGTFALIVYLVIAGSTAFACGMPTMMFCSCPGSVGKIGVFGWLQE